MSETDAGVHEVVWANLPTETFLANLRHVGDLVHELRLLDAGGRSGAVEVPAQLWATIQEILDAYEEPHKDVWRQTTEAAEAGRQRVDVTVRLPPGAVEAARRLLDLLERADELCRQGVLMTMPATEAVVEVRRWTCVELERQVVQGAEPVPHP